MRKIIICDKNKEVTDAVSKLLEEYGKGVFDEVTVIHGDIIEVHEQTPNSKIVTASNPDFSPDGGLDELLAKKYGWSDPEEFSTSSDHLFFVKSVDEERRSSKEILLRAAVGVLGHSHLFTPIVSGLGTGVGGIAINVFCEIVKAILSNLRSADLRSADLSSADLRWADLSSADLRWANLRSADLRSADLSSADFRWADLSSADLSSADLRSANLRSADLSSVNLRSATEAIKLWSQLNILKFQVGKLRAFKYVTEDGLSPIQTSNKIQYVVGKSYSLPKRSCDYSDLTDCGPGLNVATLEWCLREMDIEKHDLLEVEFDAKDIVSIPFQTDGKFRVRKLKVVKKWTQRKVRGYLVKEIK